MQEKELLRKLGEETIYSAKSHFKAVDLRRQLITYTIWICAILNIIGIIGINTLVDKWLSAIGLLGTIALLIWNEGEGKNYRARHKQAGEMYLALHKEIRACYFLCECSRETVKAVSAKVSEFDKSEKPEIPSYATVLAKKAIEKKGETDNWFRENEGNL